MQYLLDSCTFIWLSAEPEKLGKNCAQILDDHDNEILVSDVTSLELSLKWKSNKLKLPEPPRLWIEKQKSIWQFSTLGIKSEHIYRTTELESFHKDPFDRLLIAQAVAENLCILTPDELFSSYPVATSW